jgi:hypothetical protein
MLKYGRGSAGCSSEAGVTAGFVDFISGSALFDDLIRYRNSFGILPSYSLEDACRY